MYPTEDRPRLEAEVDAKIRASRVETPTLVILVGSSPALAAAEAKRQLRNVSDRDLKRFAFLYIDIDRRAAREAQEAFSARYSVPFRELNLRLEVPHDIKKTDKVKQPQPASQLGYGQANEPQTFIGRIIPESFDAGAGGNRNNGHTALCFHYGEVANKIEEAIRAITNLDNDGEATAVTNITVHIVAFLGGGTGSGILPDIAVITRQALKSTAAMKHRLNIFCMLPENLRGATSNMAKARSNATATLLELLALSHAGKRDMHAYAKYYRNQAVVVEGAVADEIFLIGRSNMNNTEDIARIIGFDLAQRITDASGVGDLERSKAVDRHQLGGYTSDWRQLLTLFSLSCPVETCFPAEDTAIAFAQIAASKVLPMMGEIAAPTSVQQTAMDQRQYWLDHWAAVAVVSENTADPMALKMPDQLSPLAVRGIHSQTSLTDLEYTLNRSVSDIDTRCREIIARKQAMEEDRILQAVTLQSYEYGLLGTRTRALELLRAEYAVVQDELKRKQPPPAEKPDANLGHKYLKDRNNPFQRDKAAENYAKYWNYYFEDVYKALRHSLLVDLLTRMIAKVEEELRKIDDLRQKADFVGAALELRERGEGSPSWRGRIEHPHPHQRHIFDLPAFRLTNGKNQGVMRLYAAITTSLNGNPSPDFGIDDIDYQPLAKQTLEFVTRRTTRLGETEHQGDGDLSKITTSAIARRVLETLRDFYMREFLKLNLFDLLNKAALPAQAGVTREQQMTGYLADHLKELGERLREVVDINPSISLDVSLDTSVYIGMNMRESNHRQILSAVLNGLEHFGTPQIKEMIDPHRLQIAASVHGFSLSNIRQLYNVDMNSMMADYLKLQRQWEDSDGEALPTHSSSEMERLVWDPAALGNEFALPDRVIRTGEEHVYSKLHPDTSPGQGYRSHREHLN